MASSLDCRPRPTGRTVAAQGREGQAPHPGSQGGRSQTFWSVGCPWAPRLVWMVLSETMVPGAGEGDYTHHLPLPCSREGVLGRISNSHAAGAQVEQILTLGFDPGP